MKQLSCVHLTIYLEKCAKKRKTWFAFPVKLSEQNVCERKSLKVFSFSLTWNISPSFFSDSLILLMRFPLFYTSFYRIFIIITESIIFFLFSHSSFFSRPFCLFLCFFLFAFAIFIIFLLLSPPSHLHFSLVVLALMLILCCILMLLLRFAFISSFYIIIWIEIFFVFLLFFAFSSSSSSFAFFVAFCWCLQVNVSLMHFSHFTVFFLYFVSPLLSYIQ